MANMLQRLLSEPPDSHTMGIAEAKPCAAILAVTADIRLYSTVLDATTSDGWRIRWARSLDRAVEICAAEPIPIVIYDGHLPQIKWTHAFDSLSRTPNRPRLLLAADAVDEPLWREVLRCHGYDAVRRSAGAEELRRTFRFAFLSLLAPAIA